jgi:hypothetical protein
MCCDPHVPCYTNHVLFAFYYSIVSLDTHLRAISTCSWLISFSHQGYNHLYLPLDHQYIVNWVSFHPSRTHGWATLIVDPIQWPFNLAKNLEKVLHVGILHQCIRYLQFLWLDFVSIFWRPNSWWRKNWICLFSYDTKVMLFPFDILFVMVSGVRFATLLSNYPCNALVQPHRISNMISKQPKDFNMLYYNLAFLPQVFVKTHLSSYRMLVGKLGPHIGQSSGIRFGVSFRGSNEYFCFGSLDFGI